MVSEWFNRADWKHWKHVGKCRLWEAVVLTFDIDPRGLYWEATTGALTARQGGYLKPGVATDIYSRLAVAISNLGDGISRHDVLSRGPNYTAQITLRDFGAWAPKEWNLPDGFPGAEAAADTGPPVPGWPWGNYETPHLKAFAEAGKEFFSKPIARGNEPKSEAIVEFLMNRDVPKQMAQIMARILRDPETPAGPRRDPPQKKK